MDLNRTSKVDCRLDSEVQGALLPPLTAHDGGEVDVVEHGGAVHTFAGVLTRRRKPIYGEINFT